jgi:hypothetical protein
MWPRRPMPLLVYDLDNIQRQHSCLHSIPVPTCCALILSSPSPWTLTLKSARWKACSTLWADTAGRTKGGAGNSPLVATAFVRPFLCHNNATTSPNRCCLQGLGDGGLLYRWIWRRWLPRRLVVHRWVSIPPFTSRLQAPAWWDVASTEPR